MKSRSLLFAILLIMGSTLAFSQSFKFGLKGGADMHKMTGKSFKEEFTFGYHVGAFAEIGIIPLLSIQPEVYFSQVNVDSGSSFNAIYTFNKVPNLKLSYLNIPILLNINLAKTVSLQLGPQYNILINQNNDLVQNGTDAFKKGDFCVVGGLQVKVSRFRIYGRYVVGMSNINDIDNQEKWKTQTVHLGVGFSF